MEMVCSREKAKTNLAKKTNFRDYTIENGIVELKPGEVQHLLQSR
jgi:hypothetical protein